MRACPGVARPVCPRSAFRPPPGLFALFASGSRPLRCARVLRPLRRGAPVAASRARSGVIALAALAGPAPPRLRPPLYRPARVRACALRGRCCPRSPCAPFCGRLRAPCSVALAALRAWLRSLRGARLPLAGPPSGLRGRLPPPRAAGRPLGAFFRLAARGLTARVLRPLACAPRLPRGFSAALCAVLRCALQGFRRALPSGGATDPRDASLDALEPCLPAVASCSPWRACCVPAPLRFVLPFPSPLPFPAGEREGDGLESGPAGPTAASGSGSPGGADRTARRRQALPPPIVAAWSSLPFGRCAGLDRAAKKKSA